MIHNQWTPEEIAALQRMYIDETVTFSQMEQYFRRGRGTIKQQARRWSLRRPAPQLWSPSEIDDLKRMYPDEDISYEQMEQHFERTWSSITGKAQPLGLRRPHPNTCQTIRDYFHVINSDEKAYWLGFIAADGTVVCTSRQYSIILDLQPRDLHWLARFRDTIASGATITKHGTRSYAVCIGSKELVQDVMALGIGPRKSNTLAWPNIPEPFIPAFLLGYFDGDGSLQKRSNNGRWLWTLVGTLPFLTMARKYIQEYAGVEIQEPVRAQKNRCPHLYRIHAYSQQAIKIDRTLNSSGLGIPRKHLDSMNQ